MRIYFYLLGILLLVFTAWVKAKKYGAGATLGNPNAASSSAHQVELGKVDAKDDPRPVLIPWKPGMLEGHTLESKNGADTLRMIFSKAGDVQLEASSGEKITELAVGYGLRWEITESGLLQVVPSGDWHRPYSRTYELSEFTKDSIVVVSGDEKLTFQRFPTPIPEK